MTPFQALLFFLREAFTSLGRSWKIHLLAIVTISVSLFIGGAFLLVSGNLTRVMKEWRRDARIVVYLEEGAPELPDGLMARPWVDAVERVTSGEAEERFRAVFPSLADLLSGWGEGKRLPASLEIEYVPERVTGEELDAWLERLRAAEGVQMVDDDRLWLRQLERLNAVLKASGLILGICLLTAAIFTISSVIRLTVYLHRHEIGVLRLVGATSFMIRGPFFIEGLIQGLMGGVLAGAGLFGAFRLVAFQGLPTVFGSVLFDRFLSPAALVGLVLLGGMAGLFGAVLSLRRPEE